MRNVKSLLPTLLVACLFSSLSFAAATPDRINGALASGQTVRLSGNVHGLARPEFDLGRADGRRMIEGVSLSFRLSAAQQKDLDQFLLELADKKSPNFHKYLTPKQFGARFGMSQNDLDKITAWLQGQGFTNISVANSRNRISFNGTIAQVETAFGTEMHNFAVDGVVHTANAMQPALPAALGGAVLNVGHLNDFAPKPRAARPHLTSYVSGNHYLSPGDFATIYGLQPLYSAGMTGSGQKIAVVGQTSVSATDLSTFRSAAGLTANAPTLTLIEGTSTRCSGDEFEADLDLEWSGGVAKDASITFLYAGLDLTSGDSCTGNRFDNVWDALQYAVDHNVAPIISTSYGFCEAGLPTGFPAEIQSWAQQGQTQGQTIVAASGDSGAADCDQGASGTLGLAVDVPAAIPEVTGAGGNTFAVDSPTYTTPNPPGANPPYWSAAGTTTDTLSSALEYITEKAWNDTATNGVLASSGGGESILFAKPSWQTGTGVGSGTFRYVPDISLSASPDHDPYLLCSEDNGAGGIVSTCTAGFRTGAGGSFTAVGGTSAAAPTFAGILALINQYLGNTPPTGLAPVNPTLYTLVASTPAAFNDVTSGSNIVPCTASTTGCTTGSYGFVAGVGYDPVTGLGSVNGFTLAQAWAGTLSSFSMTPTPLNPVTVVAGHSITSAVTIVPDDGFTGTVSFTCSGLPSGSSCSFSPSTVTGGSGSTTITIQTPAGLAAATTTVTVKGTSGATSATTTVSLTVTATDQSFTLASDAATYQVLQGSTLSNISITLTPVNGFNLVNSPVTYTCTGYPQESTCLGPSGPTPTTPVSFAITTTPATTARRDGGSRIFYAAFMPGLLGLMLTFGARKKSLRGMRMLGMIVVLGCSTMWLGACGGGGGSGTGGGGNPGTPKGTSTITITGTNGSLSTTTTFQLTVQ